MAMTATSYSLSEAVERYEVSSTLAFRLRVGEIPGRKVRGPRNQAWRVEPSDLEAAGYLPRESSDTFGAEDKLLRRTSVVPSDRCRRGLRNSNGAVSSRRRSSKGCRTSDATVPDLAELDELVRATTSC